jgi:hypothetical protein
LATTFIAILAWDLSGSDIEVLNRWVRRITYLLKIPTLFQLSTEVPVELTVGGSIERIHFGKGDVSHDL